jgi:eukaryotic-like serine/threonine-protein kinase
MALALRYQLPMTAVYTSSSQIDHYKIIRQLGRGGMSRVYLALDTRNQQQVVLKFPNDDLIGDITVYERYKREAEIGHRVKHPHVLRLLNPDEHHSDEYLVMEYVHGQTLRELLEEHNSQPLPVSEALHIILQICDALVFCHEQGIFHRDIKPENILVQDDGNIKIIDFGIARLEGARRVTWRGLTCMTGTPDYMSPERLKGERGAGACDMYAVGILLYEMLSGRTPFDGENVFAVMNKHMRMDPPSILDFNQSLSPELATVIMKAIRRDQKKRFQSLREMQHALQNLHEVQPVSYEPDAPHPHHARQEVFMVTWIVLTIFAVMISLGVFAQLAHSILH